MPTTKKNIHTKTKKELCGVIVYSHPSPTASEEKSLERKLQTPKRNKHNNRVIIHPKYRTTGLGAKLVRETLTKAGTPYVETLAVMAKYNPFFEKAGMKK
ncbi:hypothetical protein DRO59_06585 [Candidatus Bathyarchaeota archaeon]|nr:MAG: hypothetical protein DRO59_06585 [Candidatus Bathyarchaeota archaeon]